MATKPFSSRLRHLFGTLIFLSSPLLFVNCDRVQFRDMDRDEPSRENRVPTSQAGGNGDGYGGKLTVYNYRDAANPCLEKNSKGEALPNAQLFFVKEDSLLVREKCRDIEAQSIPADQIEFANDGSVTYDNRRFDEHLPSEFDLLTASCPAGLTLKAGAQRKSLFTSSLDLAASSWDTMDSSVMASLSGSFGGIPAYRVERTKVGNPDWLRLNEFIEMKANTRYAISFFVRADSASTLRFHVYDYRPVVSEAIVSWDLNSGNELQMQNNGLNDVAIDKRAISGGYYITYHFRSGPQFYGLDIGFSSRETPQGSAIIMAAPTLEDMDAICE